MSVDTTYKKWLYSNKNPRHARYIWLRSSLVVDLLFNDKFVNRSNDRNKQDDLRAMDNLCRFHDIKYDTDLHQKFTLWLKKKEIKWNNRTYSFPKEQLSLKQVLENISKLEPYSERFCSVHAYIRTLETRIVIENHNKFCHGGVLEIFWSKKTKNTNATFCFPSLYDRMDRKFVFDYDFKVLGCELRYL